MQLLKKNSDVLSFAGVVVVVVPLAVEVVVVTVVVTAFFFILWLMILKNVQYSATANEL